MKMKKTAKPAKDSSSTKNPHKARRDNPPAAAKGMGKIGVNKLGGGKSKSKY